MPSTAPTSAIDPRTPVIIGVARITGQRAALPGKEPLQMWEDVARAAAGDAGLPPATLRELDAVLVTDCMSWRYDDPVMRLAQRLDASPNVREVSAPSGTAGQSMVNKLCKALTSGEAEVGLICGAEALATVRHFRMRGEAPDWSFPHPDGPQYAFDLDAHQHPGEAAIGLTEGVGAVYGFAMRDLARRAARGTSPEAYRAELGETLAGMTRVAARNPHAWFQAERTADELVDAVPSNRMIAYPYAKSMVAIIDVDMAAGLLIATEGWANAHDIARENRVYPWTSCYAEDPVAIAVRKDLARSPAMAAAASATLEAAGVTAADIDHVDLYSCFTSAVNFGRDALGIGDRGGDAVTLTGGLPYGGGPGSSYMLTSITALAERLRADPDGKGLVSGVGMMMSNHVFAIYAAAPPPQDLRHIDQAAIQRELDAIAQCPITDGASGPARVVTYTVMHDRSGNPTHGAAICDLPDGSRCYARIRDPEILQRAEAEEIIGRDVQLVAEDIVSLIVKLN
ncbi:hypothetical protein OLX02_12310 [Novosphingobium sp. KCTC 2891]|uniref:thiolase C-terminal domain-containing protein n=1 Tax=Novosphingobium sp. KCTC 2891 TaxID=2989730 RepID=UPI00222220C4|nr:hypothetical protein [Novosphingobium sp. KCTC 2891]MCW1383603.1 hypothetical protein [Novosphingobium sp. KCTC 2891]